MSYKIYFKEQALKEWQKLNSNIKEQFKKKLEKIIENPHVPSAKISGFETSQCYKIKLRSSGYRLVYKVEDQKLTIVVIGVEKRDKNSIYNVCKKRI